MNATIILEFSVGLYIYFILLQDKMEEKVGFDIATMALDFNGSQGHSFEKIENS